MNLPARLERYRRFYAEDRPGAVLICASYPRPSSGPTWTLLDFDFTRLSEHQRYWDLLLDSTLRGLEGRDELDDDLIPGIILHYGFGAFGAVYCDVPLVFTDNTSYMAHALTTWDEWEGCRYEASRFWSEVFVEAARYLSEKADGAFFVDPYPNPSPLDVANLVMGNELFTAFYEQPERLRALLAHFTAEVTRNWQTVQAAKVNQPPGTMCFGAWVPQGPLLLEDAADLCSPQTYQEFGRPYTGQVLAAGGGGYIHHHSLGRQQYANMASLADLTVLQISSDPNCVRPAEDLPYLLEQVGTHPCDLEVTPEEIRGHMDQLTQGRFLCRTNCGSLDEARTLVEFVRGHSREL
ncbi:MAG: hypothetical protein WCP21_12190 [Armatimonadota bacterium]